MYVSEHFVLLVCVLVLSMTLLSYTVTCTCTYNMLALPKRDCACTTRTVVTLSKVILGGCLFSPVVVVLLCTCCTCV